MGGTPPPPFTDKIFGKKGVTDLGVPHPFPPPFTDKIRKVVFDVLPYLPTYLPTAEYFEVLLGSLRYLLVFLGTSWYF